jgi:hypothetical protein
LIEAITGERKTVWEPLPQQKVAMECPCFELLFGGAKGGGKTGFLVACVAPILAYAHQKWMETGQQQRTTRIMVFRRHLDDLSDFIAKSFEFYPHLDPQMGPDGWHEKAKMWRFTSGATVEINHLAEPKSHEAFNGQEFAALLMDEVQFIPQEAYTFLMAQVRSKDPELRKLLMVRCTANPGGPHGEWVKRHWNIDTCPEGGKIFVEQVKIADGRLVETTRAFLRSYLKDNYHLNADGAYEAQLRTAWKWSPEQIRQYIEGDFDAVSGAFFAHLLKPMVHFEKGRLLPPTWEYVFSIDWGSDAPACCLWAALDPDGRLWVFDELHQPGVTGRLFGEAMREKYKYQKWSTGHLWRHDDFFGLIDTQAFDRYGSDATAGAGIQEKGFRIFGAQKDPGERRAGIIQIKERLSLDRNGKPQVIVFEDRCPKLASALKSIQSKPLDVDDYDPKSPHAHAIDAFRFIHMHWPVRPVLETNKQDVDVAAWERLLRAQQQLASDTGGFHSGY